MKKSPKGFTLIELMVLVVILGILAAATIPVFVNHMKRSKSAEATINIKAIIEGVVSYYSTRRSMMLRFPLF